MGLHVQSGIDRLLASDEPCVQYKVRVGVLGESPTSAGIKKLANTVRQSPRVRTLLSDAGEDGRIPFHPYSREKMARRSMPCIGCHGQRVVGCLR